MFMQCIDLIFSYTEAKFDFFYVYVQLTIIQNKKDFIFLFLVKGKKNSKTEPRKIKFSIVWIIKN